MKRSLAVALVFLAGTARAAPEPWSDTDPDTGPSRMVVGESGVRASAEYRANALAIRSLSTSPAGQNASWIEQRLRLDGAVDYREVVRVTTSIDALDGVVWGKSGHADAPGALTTNPDVTRICLGPAAADPTDPSSYALATCDADPLFVRRLYGEVLLPFGLFRVGRQAYDDGNGVLVADGDGRRNRFGIAYRGDNVDRVLFATKPLEAFRSAEERDALADRGLFLLLAYDRVAAGQPQRFAGDANEWVTALRLLAPRIGLLREIEARLFHAYRWERTHDTGVHATGGRLSYRIGDWAVGFDTAYALGASRDRRIQQLGFRAVARWDREPIGAYLELDYASGDSPPGPGTALTRFSFARDTNVGLLLFEHVLGYQSARAAAAAAALGATDAQAIATNGAFTNALAVFPQIDIRPIDSLLVRLGVLLATAPSDVVDPVRSARGQAVNLAGGRPSSAYGTELDARVGWRYEDHFALDVEGAVLLPGSALADENGAAPRAAMVQGRGTFYF